MKYFLFALFIFFNSYQAQVQAKPIIIGSKKFTESVTLGEIARLALSQKEIKAEHKAELGGTRILWNALLTGDIDIYPEYTGTITEEILKENINSFDELKLKLEQKGIGISTPLGFNNTYAIGMKKARADSLGVKNISDLNRHLDLKIGLSEEFRQRQDGWPGLKEKYKLPHKFVRGLDHDIAYRALETNDIDVTDFYSTDAEIKYYDLTSLIDDLNYFPKYEAVYLYRLDLKEKNPLAEKTINSFSGKISEQKMINLNNMVKIDKLPSAKAASYFLNEAFGVEVDYKLATQKERILVRTKEHIYLVTIALVVAILIAVPLGVIAFKIPSLGKFILWFIGAVQTIPALALLVLLIKPLNLLGLRGIGDTPALIALILYALLPIVRATHNGFSQIPKALIKTAQVLNFSFKTMLFKIELPLALTSILSGIKTAAVMTVGFATLGALVGAGGFGQPILTGIRLDDYNLILEGSIPAVLLTLVVSQLFDFIENFIVSPGLK
ncbi:MAG: ABC transporter permease subunit [Oligoflexia bacterium]|nr:ABC transporter permease subunit [Oligoflexia bacterium]